MRGFREVTSRLASVLQKEDTLMLLTCPAILGAPDRRSRQEDRGIDDHQSISGCGGWIGDDRRLLGFMISRLALLWALEKGRGWQPRLWGANRDLGTTPTADPKACSVTTRDVSIAAGRDTRANTWYDSRRQRMPRRPSHGGFMQPARRAKDLPEH